MAEKSQQWRSHNTVRSLSHNHLPQAPSNPFQRFASVSFRGIALHCSTCPVSRRGPRGLRRFWGVADHPAVLPPGISLQATRRLVEQAFTHGTFPGFFARSQRAIQLSRLDMMKSVRRGPFAPLSRRMYVWMCLSIYLSIFLSMSFYLSIYLSIFLSIYLKS